MLTRVRPGPLTGLGATAVLLLTGLLVGCDSSSTGPASSSPASFSREVSLPDLQSQLTGPARVAVSVVPGTLVARRIEIEGQDQLTRREQVRSRVTAITAGTDTATLTLELGGLNIAVNGSTRLRPDDGDGEHGWMPSDGGQDGGSMTLADFVARIQADIAAGHNPAVKATRQAPAQPQAVDDGSFLAGELQLDEGEDHGLIELNISPASLVTNATPPPDAFLKLLGLSLEIRTSDGTTTLRVQNDDVEGVREFDGVVQSVDQTANTVTLKDGTIIKIVAGTEFEPREGDEDDHLTTLADVQAALTAGKTVKVEGRGLVDTTSPLTFDAVRIEFEVEGEELPPPTMMTEFEDTVASVDVSGGTFTLGHGAVVTLTTNTMIDHDGLQTLQAVSDALAAHTAVRAEGVAKVTAAGPPPALTALFVKFETESH